MLEDQSKIVFHYLKNNDFRTVLSTGAIGGITSHGLINVNFFTDRPPIPQSVTYNIEDNKLGEEQERSTKSGIVREIHFGVNMDLNSARELKDYLEKLINQIELIKS